MLVKSQIKNISEKELEDLVRQRPELIEDGLQFIDHQIPTQNYDNKGRLDVLFVDSDSRLVIAELKVVENDKMLSQAIDYFDYINSNLETISRLHKEFKIDPIKTPTILLIAPSFSQTLINRCKWIDIKIQLKRYFHLELEGDSKKKTIYFDDVPIPAKIEPMEVNTVEKHINYIKDKNVKEFAYDLLEEVKKWDESNISIVPTKYGISMKLSGRVFGALYPKRKFFYVDYIEDETWMRYDISEEDSIAEVVAKLMQSFDYISSLLDL